MQGSLVNEIYKAVRVSALPAAGMDATITYYTDRQAATVYDYDPKTRIVTVREDEVTRPFEAKPYSQDWVCKPNPQGAVSHFRLGGSGRWERVVRNSETGRWNKVKCGGLIIGVKDHYYDFQF